MRTNHYYQRVLADIHDRNFNRFGVAAGKWVSDVLQSAGIDSGLVVDLGCGGGQLLEIVSRSGFDAMGIDRSGDFINLAQIRCPTATIIEGDLWHFEMPSCVAVTAVGEVLNYNQDGTATDRRMIQLFKRVYSALCHRGVFLFDLRCLSMLAQPAPNPKTYTGHGWVLTVNVAFSHETNSMKRHLALQIMNATGSVKAFSETHLMRLYDQSKVCQWLEMAGFVVSTEDYYPAIKPRPHHQVFLAVKA